MSLWPCSMVKDMSEPHYPVDTSLDLLLPPFVDAALFCAPSLQKAGGRVGLVCLCLDVLSTTEQLSGLSCCDVCALNAGGSLPRGAEVFRSVVSVRA